MKEVQRRKIEDLLQGDDVGFGLGDDPCRLDPVGACERGRSPRARPVVIDRTVQNGPSVPCPQPQVL